MGQTKSKWLPSCEQENSDKKVGLKRVFASKFNLFIGKILSNLDAFLLE